MEHEAALAQQDAAGGGRSPARDSQQPVHCHVNHGHLRAGPGALTPTPPRVTLQSQPGVPEGAGAARRDVQPPLYGRPESRIGAWTLGASTGRGPKMHLERLFTRHADGEWLRPHACSRPEHHRRDRECKPSPNPTPLAAAHPLRDHRLRPPEPLLLPLRRVPRRRGEARLGQLVLREVPAVQLHEEPRSFAGMFANDRRGGGQPH